MQFLTRVGTEYPHIRHLWWCAAFFITFLQCYYQQSQRPSDVSHRFTRFRQWRSRAGRKGNIGPQFQTNVQRGSSISETVRNTTQYIYTFCIEWSYDLPDYWPFLLGQPVRRKHTFSSYRPRQKTNTFEILLTYIDIVSRDSVPRSKSVKVLNDDFLADSINILIRWKKYSYFAELFNVQRFSDVRQIEMHTDEPLVPDPTLSGVENRRGIYHQSVTKFRQNWFKQEMKHYGLKSINSLILFGIRKNFLFSGRSLLLYKFARRAMELTVVIIVGYHCYQLHTKCYPIFFSQH
jgi:hypothetical protein